MNVDDVDVDAADDGEDDVDIDDEGSRLPACQ